MSSVERVLIGGMPSLDMMHLPGSTGMPFLGHALAFLKDARLLVTEMHGLYGPNFRIHLTRNPIFIVGEPALVENVLQDTEKVFSSKWGWDHDLGKLFSGGLILRDFDEHRAHRKAIAGAFRPEAIRGYAAMTEQIVNEVLAQWEGQPIRLFYPAVKNLMLDIAARVFFGMPLGPRFAQVNQAFSRMERASIALVKMELPGSLFSKGMRGRRFLENLLIGQVQERRTVGGKEISSQLCQSETTHGLSDQEIVQHMIFLLLAAHDTLASALTSMVWLLAEHQEWQERLRAEVLTARVDSEPGGRLQSKWVFREALRMYPPVPFIARRTLAACQLGSYRLPANAALAVCPLLTHQLEEVWSHPLEFDPERFSDARREDKRHNYAWYPFGGGSHACIGGTLAELQAEIFIGALLRRFYIVLPPGYRIDMAAVPFPKPRDGLPIELVRRL